MGAPRAKKQRSTSAPPLGVPKAQQERTAEAQRQGADPLTALDPAGQVDFYLRARALDEKEQRPAQQMGEQAKVARGGEARPAKRRQTMGPWERPEDTDDAGSQDGGGPEPEPDPGMLEPEDEERHTSERQGKKRRPEQERQVAQQDRHLPRKQQAQPDKRQKMDVVDQEVQQGPRLPPRAKGRPRKISSQEQKEAARSRSRSPRLEEEDEDRSNIAFVQQQKLNPWHFRIAIMGTVVAGPLRPTVAAAREDRARLHREMAELKEEGKLGQELLQAMQAKAKALKGEVKAEKHKAACERQKAAKRASYAADRDRTRQLALQESQSQETQTGGEEEGGGQAGARGGAPGEAERRPPPAGQKREAEVQDWDDRAEERRLKRLQAYEKKLANMRASYDPAKRRSRHQASQEEKRRASQASQEEGEVRQDALAEGREDWAQGQPAAPRERDIAMGRGRGGRPKQQPEQEQRGGDLREPGKREGVKPQQKGKQVPAPKWAPRAGGKMAGAEVAEQSDDTAAHGMAKQPKAKEQEPDWKEVTEENQQQRPVEAVRSPGPKRRSTRKQKD